MELAEYYDLIFRGEYSEVLSLLKTSDNDTQHLNLNCIYALAKASMKNPTEARALLDGINRESIGSEAKAICFEAEMLIEAYDGKDEQKLEFLAEQAIEHNQGSIFAHRVLADFEESRKHFEKALQHFQAALEIYPESARTQLDLARNLLFLKRRGEALSLINAAPRSFRRSLYRIVIALRGILRIPIILLIAFLVLNPGTSVVAFWTITAICLIGLISSLRLSDNLIFSTYVYFQFAVIVIGLISFVLTRVLIE
jgi:tetratricopeptide (TPR) repeat protein